VGKRWTPAEKDLLSRVYSDTTIDELLEAFPDRTPSAIHAKAFQLRLKKSAQWLDSYVISMRKPKPPKEPKLLREPSEVKFSKTEREVLEAFGTSLSIPELKMMLPRKTINQIVKMKIELGM